MGSLPPEQLKGYRDLVPLRRFGTPADVAQAVLFLAAKEAAYITGATLDVTGGL
ncbi:MAG: SDR family oxidoreductase [bacterium]